MTEEFICCTRKDVRFVNLVNGTIRVNNYLILENNLENLWGFDRKLR